LWTASFGLLKRNRLVPVAVSLSQAGLHLKETDKNRSQSYHLDEVASCAIIPNEKLNEQTKRSCFESAPRDHHSVLDTSVCLELVVYTRKAGNSQKRHRKQVTLSISGHADYEDNLREANVFVGKIDS